MCSINQPAADMLPMKGILPRLNVKLPWALLPQEVILFSCCLSFFLEEILKEDSDTTNRRSQMTVLKSPSAPNVFCFLLLHFDV